MAQASGPISQGTTAERQFTDVLWRDLFGDESGVVGDTDGTAYKLTLPTDSNNAQVGSSTIRSNARVAGFAHAIPAGSPETVDIPTATSTRTDLIVLRYDPAYTGAPGPVRLVRIPGTSASVPAYDDAPPGVEDLPLWTVTRAPGQSLSQATVKRVFTRIAPVLTVETGVTLPTSSPLGTILQQGAETYRRELAGTPTPVPAWVRQKKAEGFLASASPSGYFGTSGNVFNLGATGQVTLTSARRVKATVSMSGYAPNLNQSVTVYVSHFINGGSRTVFAQQVFNVGGGTNALKTLPVVGHTTLQPGTYTFRVEGSSSAPTGSSPEASGVAQVDPVGMPALIIEDIGPA